MWLHPCPAPCIASRLGTSSSRKFPDVVEILCEPGQVTFIYSLSAIEPTRQRAALARACSILKPNGRLLLRDYAIGDLAHLRQRPGTRLSANVYCRGDLTLVHYLGVAEARALIESVGFATDYCCYENRTVHNHRLGKVMYRRWLLGSFRKVVP